MKEIQSLIKILKDHIEQSRNELLDLKLFPFQLRVTICTTLGYNYDLCNADAWMSGP
jgi:hypothetical protein